jgi:hypothetical protein
MIGWMNLLALMGQKNKKSLSNKHKYRRCRLSKSSIVFLLSTQLFASDDSAMAQAWDDFTAINQHLQSITADNDVHVLDQYVMAPGNQAEKLANFARLYGRGENHLTLAEVGQQMDFFITDNPDFFNDFKFNDFKFNVITLTVEELKGYIHKHFDHMDSEISMCPHSREIWSRAWTGAQGSEDAIKILYDMMVESYLTQGGCIQGRINRGFKGLVGVLNITL